MEDLRWWFQLWRSLVLLDDESGRGCWWGYWWGGCWNLGWNLCRQWFIWWSNCGISEVRHIIRCLSRFEYSGLFDYSDVTLRICGIYSIALNFDIVGSRLNRKFGDCIQRRAWALVFRWVYQILGRNRADISNCCSIQLGVNEWGLVLPWWWF